MERKKTPTELVAKNLENSTIRTEDEKRIVIVAAEVEVQLAVVVGQIGLKVPEEIAIPGAKAPKEGDLKLKLFSLLDGNLKLLSIIPVYFFCLFIICS